MDKPAKLIGQTLAGRFEVSVYLHTNDVGDVYVGIEQAGRQAAEHGVPLDEELVRLAVHGTPHVVGHDHPEGPERLESPMFVLQERLVRDVMEGA